LTGIVINGLELKAKLRDKVEYGEGCDQSELDSLRHKIDALESMQVELDNFQASGRDVDLLPAAFSNISNYGNARRLKRLNLEASVFKQVDVSCPTLDEGSWKLIWRCTGKTLKSVFAAIAALGVFRGLQRCSVACNEISGALLHLKAQNALLQNLVALSISLCDRIIDETDRDSLLLCDPYEEFDWSVTPVRRDSADIVAEAADERNWSGLSEVLRLCPSLESLTIHFYRLQNGGVLLDRDLTRHKLLEGIVSDDKLTGLRQSSSWASTRMSLPCWLSYNRRQFRT
jgi:hypothetical protein